jgi:hypothetical protein
MIMRPAGMRPVAMRPVVMRPVVMHADNSPEEKVHD